MRLRKIATVLATTVTATALLTAPASAGVGESGYCFDGGWTDIPVLQTPITLGVETNVTATGTWIAVCYATSPVGSGAAHATGGLFKVFINPLTQTGFVECRPDANPYVVLVDCNGTYDFNLVGGPASIVFDSIVVDSNVTAPISLGKTGVEVNPGILEPGGAVLDPEYPCVWVNGISLIAGCSTDIV